jgi:uncharacterized phage-associated protein
MKADDVASVIIARCGSWLTAMQLQKLLYYVEAWHLAITDRALLDEDIEAWEKGPVVPEVRNLRRSAASRLAGNAPGVELDATASGIIDLVLSTYGSLSGDEMSYLTHAELPWVEARRGLRNDAPSNRAISKESMAEFYRERRRLDGRTAADLAAIGVFNRSLDQNDERVDVDSLLAGLSRDLDDPGDDPIGGSSLDVPPDLDLDGIETQPRHAYAD